MAGSISGEANPAGVTVENEVLKVGGVSVTFNRTLRVPDDGSTYPLPPGLGYFPVRRVTDYPDRVPESWRKHGGVFLPMYQREALWLRFSGRSWKPNAVKLGVGKVCALTGKPWSESLHAAPDKQDYIAVPTQPFIDGINSGRDTVRQFVAMPLGMGYTVEGQVTGEEKHGGLQLCVFEPKAGIFPDQAPGFGPVHRVGGWGGGVSGSGRRPGFGFDSAAAAANKYASPTSCFGAAPPAGLFGAAPASGSAAASGSAMVVSSSPAASSIFGSAGGNAAFGGPLERVPASSVSFGAAQPSAASAFGSARLGAAAAPLRSDTSFDGPAPVAFCSTGAFGSAGGQSPQWPGRWNLEAPVEPRVVERVSPAGMEMGLAAGGRMRQEIYADPYGVYVWDQASSARVFVHLCNSAMWRQITGEAPPESPVTAQTYAKHGLPWFEVYDEGRMGIDGSATLAGVKSVKEMDAAKGFGPQQDDSSVFAWNVHKFALPPVDKTRVMDGEW